MLSDTTTLQGLHLPTFMFIIAGYRVFPMIDVLNSATLPVYLCDTIQALVTRTSFPSFSFLVSFLPRFLVPLARHCYNIPTLSLSSPTCGCPFFCHSLFLFTFCSFFALYPPQPTVQALYALNTRRHGHLLFIFRYCSGFTSYACHPQPLYTSSACWFVRCRTLPEHQRLVSATNTKSWRLLSILCPDLTSTRLRLSGSCLAS
jgi:hypothetical protein